ncbi:MAG: hypothetical protein ACTSP4_00070 [Candidatus Hodarchaeales archaeon]
MNSTEKVYPKIKPSEKLKEAIIAIKNLNDHHDYQRLASLITLHGNLPSLCNKIEQEYILDPKLRSNICSYCNKKILSCLPITVINDEETEQYCTTDCELFACLDGLGLQDSLHAIIQYYINEIARLEQQVIDYRANEMLQEDESN